MNGDDQKNGNGSGRSSWNEYQRLVLNELTRFNDLTTGIIRTQNEILIQIALLKEESVKIGRLEARADSADRRINKLEQAAGTGDALGKYKKYLIGILIALISAIVIPLISLYISTR